MRTFDTPFPSTPRCRTLTAALAQNNAAVLVAPPGAGKTTRVPLVLLDEPWAKDKKILVLEPRRLAARAAAARMASTLGEQVGDTVGLRVRFGSKVCKRTRIEVVTEGVFTRLVLDDPSLDGIAAVLFDEFHERSLDADLGLALGARRASRPARGPENSRHVGDAGRRPRRRAAWRCAGGRERRPRLSGRDPLSRPRHARAHRAAGGRRGARGAYAPTPARCWCSCPAPAKSAAPRRCSRSASTIPRPTSSRSMARSMRASRTAPSRRRRPAGARWCWRPRSPRPRSPSKACASSSTAGCRACRATSRMSV